MRLGPVGQQRGHRRGRAHRPWHRRRWRSRSRPAPSRRWPDAASRRDPAGCSFMRSGEALDHAADRLLALLGRQRRHRLLLLARGLRHRRVGGQARRLGNARHLGAQHRQERRVRAGSGFEFLPAPERGGAVARLRVVQAEIVEGARIVGLQGERLVEGVDGGGGHHAVGLERQRLAQRRQGVGIVRAGGERARAPAATSCANVASVCVGAGGLCAGDEGRGGQAGMADLQVEAEGQQRDRQRKRGRQQAMQGVGAAWRARLRVGVGGSEDAALDLQCARPRLRSR